MIYIRIEMWPGGQKDRARVLGEGRISNIGGSSSSGNYDVKLLKSPEYAKSPGIWKRGLVEGFPRLKLGPWDLLFQALKATVGKRNQTREEQHAQEAVEILDKMDAEGLLNHGDN